VANESRREEEEVGNKLRQEEEVTKDLGRLVVEVAK